MSEIYLVLENGMVKVGTCDHCVIEELGRPARAWDAQGDTELDFPRDELIAALKASGVEVVITQEYVCP